MSAFEEELKAREQATMVLANSPIKENVLGHILKTRPNNNYNMGLLLLQTNDHHYGYLHVTYYHTQLILSVVFKMNILEQSPAVLITRPLCPHAQGSTA